MLAMVENGKDTLGNNKQSQTHIEKNKKMMDICRRTVRNGKHTLGNNVRWKTHIKEQWNHVEEQ
jgi:ABC-type molybdenum transport system ATPase subunit/photorepair protein PhrA